MQLNNSYWAKPSWASIQHCSRQYIHTRVCVCVVFTRAESLCVCACLSFSSEQVGRDSAASRALQSAGFQLRLRPAHLLLTAAGQQHLLCLICQKHPRVHSASKLQRENCRSYKSPELKLQAGSFVWLNNWLCDRLIVCSVEAVVPSDGRRARCVCRGVLSLILKYLLSLTIDLAE